VQCNRQEKAVNTLLESPKSAILIKKGRSVAAALPERFRLLEGTQKEGEEHNV